MGRYLEFTYTRNFIRENLFRRKNVERKWKPKYKKKNQRNIVLRRMTNRSVFSEET